MLGGVGGGVVVGFSELPLTQAFQADASYCDSQGQQGRVLGQERVSGWRAANQSSDSLFMYD